MSGSASPRRGSPSEVITAALVARHALLRAGLRSVLEGDRIVIVGEADDVVAALRLADDATPDVILVDVALPDPGGIEATIRLKREQPKCAVILLTGRDDEATVYDALKAGAAAFVSKDVEPAGLLDVVRCVAAGEYLINDQVFQTPTAANRVLADFRHLSVYGAQAQVVFSPLSARETQIVDLIANGLTNKLVAAELGISEQTVKNHLSSILRKLSVNDRTQAVVYAIRAGWIALPD